MEPAGSSLLVNSGLINRPGPRSWFYSFSFSVFVLCFGAMHVRKYAAICQRPGGLGRQSDAWTEESRSHVSSASCRANPRPPLLAKPTRVYQRQAAKIPNHLMKSFSKWMVSRPKEGESWQVVVSSDAQLCLQRG
ncbi:hypothetical protein LX36DRAFT_486072 [Colletotrichum falcatum]|nr:hypothetical protein LX36DRAFT_486072 [Colletotrichum falcatum]